jgi:hypothetical protein
MRSGVLVLLSLASVAACRSPATPVPAPVVTTSQAGVEESAVGDASVGVAVEHPIEHGSEAGAEAGAPPVAAEAPDAAPARATIISSPQKGMAAPRGSHGKCVVVWYNCACAYQCRWVEPGEVGGGDCANYCGPQPAPDLRCDVVEGWCGPAGK